MKPGFGLLRRESGFSIASLAASLPGNRTKSLHGDAEEAGQQLVSVSRPGSVRSAIMDGDEETTDSEDRTEDDTGEDDDGEEEDNETDEDVDIGVGHDSRSIRSFESMLTGSARERKEASERKSLSDRLAHMPGLSRLAHSHPPKVRFFTYFMYADDNQHTLRNHHHHNALLFCLLYRLIVSIRPRHPVPNPLHLSDWHLPIAGSWSATRTT